MDTLKIYHADGTLLKDENGTEITIKSLTYTGSWMGECFVSVTFKNPAPINFSIGDYLTYRGEVFEINYDPGKIKSSSRNSTGEAFTYDSVKFNSKQYELVRAEFLDIVLNDNETHYTSLTKFPFYVQSVDDLLDRIQANLDEQYGAAVWKLYSRNETRSEQRGCLPEEWVNVYGEGIADNVIKSTSITVDGKTCWDALALVNSQFDINFIVRGRNVYVGTAGVPTSIIFEYGKGNGLYEIEQNADSEQSITTRLRAYGSTKNMPSRYYANMDGTTLPNNMAVNNLMLPGFPNQSLQEWWNAQTTETKNRIYSGSKEHIFSDNKYRPFVDSININEIGVRSNSIYFDAENLEEGIIEIYPTIEEMEVGGVRIDEVESADVIEDNGVFKDGETVPNFHIYLNSAIDFDINDLIKKSTETPLISMKDGMCGAREFQINSAKKLSDKRWELTCQRQADDSLNLYFPYNDYLIKGGDHFVLIGIPLPDSYVTAASIKLLKYALEFLDKNDYTRYVYSPKIDEIFMARQHDAAMADTTGTIQSIHDTIKEGDFMQFTDNDLGIEGSVTIDQLTIKEEDGKIPTYEVTLREDKSVGTIQKIQNKISSLESGNGGLLSAGGATSQQIQKLIESYGGKRFLSKLSPDTAQGVITFLKGIVAKAKSFFTGIDNTGDINNKGGINNTGDIYNNGDIHNDGDVLTRNLTVTGKATFFELEILKAKAAGGMTINSPGTFHADIVEDTESGYVLYQRAEQDGKTLTQMIDEKDQLFSCDFNLGTGNYTDAGNHYYWRLVTAAPTEYVTKTINGENVRCLTVTLDKTDCAKSSGVPKAGDDLMVLGNRDVPARQNAIMTSVYRSFDPGLDCPYTCQYSGIKDYNLTLRRKTWFAANGNRIKGDLVMESTDGGKSVKDALDELNGYISEVGDQIDDKIQFWFFPYQPSADTAPTSSWTTDDVKDAHVGDLFYDTARGGSYGGGTCYKWTKTVSEDGTATYAWVEVTDAQTIAALEKIADISSDGVISGGTERTMLHNQWRAAMADYTYYGAQAVNMNLTNDSVYTDFTTAYNKLAKLLNGGYTYTYTEENPDPLFASTEDISKDYRLSDYYITPSQYRDAWNTWSNAVSALAVAIQAATDNKVEALADDGIISAGTEKQQLEQAWARVTSEYARLVASATGYGINEETDPAHDTLTTYEDSYTQLAEIVTPMLGELDKDTSVDDKTKYQNGWKNYYTAASNLEKVLFDRGKTLTEGAQSDADAAQSDATAAQDAINDIVSDGMLDPTEKQTVKRDFVSYHNERKAMRDIAKCGQETAPSSPVDVENALSTWGSKFSSLATMLNGGENWSYTVDTPLTDEKMPLWLKAENMSKCTPLDNRDTYRTTWTDFLGARTALLNAVTEYARVIAESAANADYSVNVYVTGIGEGMPTAAHKGDTWKQAVELTSPYDSNVRITEDDDHNTLYNVYLCNETYDFSGGGYDPSKQSIYWTPISTPTYTAIKKLDDKILLEVIDEEGGSLIESTAKNVSIQVASSQSRNLLKGGWLEYTGWGYGGVLTKQGSMLSVMLEAGKTYTITAHGRMPNSALYVYNRKALVLANGTTVNTMPVSYDIPDSCTQQSVTEYYLATSASGGVTSGTSGWSTSLPTMSETNMYLWNYRIVVRSDGSSFSTPAVLVHTWTGSAPVGVTEYYLGYTSNSGVSTETDGWSTSPAMPNKVVRLVVHVYNGMSYPGAAIIDSTSMTVVSDTFTPTVTQTYYIDAFPQDANYANAAYRWREWALEWVVLTSGEVPAAEWTDSEADVLATGFNVKEKKITLTSDTVEVRNNSGETTALLDETGKIQTNLIVASVIRTGDMGQPHVEAKGSTFELYGYEQYPFIQIAWREDVGSVLRFVDEKTGQLLYDLGPTKFLDNFSEIQDKYEEFYMRPLANDSTIWTILASTQDAAYRYYRYTEGYKVIDGSTRQYHVSGTTTPSNYNTMYLKTASYGGTPIANGWYVEAKGRMYSAWTNSAGLTLYKATLIKFVGGKVNLFVDCYFTEAMKEYQMAVRTVGCDTNGVELNQTDYPYLWSYGVGLPSK